MADRTIVREDNVGAFREAHIENRLSPVVVDVETTGLSPWETVSAQRDRVIGVAVHFPKVNQSFYIPTYHLEEACFEPTWLVAEKQPTARKMKFPKNQRRREDGLVEELAFTYTESGSFNLPETTWHELMKPLIGPGRIVVNHNLKFDLHMLESEGLKHCGIGVDTLPLAHLLDENMPNYTLEYLGNVYTGAGKEEDLLAEWCAAFGIKKPKSRLRDCPLSLVADYAMGDVELTWELYKVLMERLKEDGLSALAGEISLYNRVIRDMETNGIYVDIEQARRDVVKAEAKTEELRKDLFAQAGREFNPSSPIQVESILYRPRIAPPGIKLKQRPTDKPTLMLMRDNPDDPRAHFADTLLEYRQWEKGLTTYYRPWLEMVDKHNRLHPSLLIHGTRAGRLSCRAPNLQNIPRTSDIYDVRSVVVAPPGRVLVSCDLSQIELRIFAHYTLDPVMCSVYQNNGDIHAITSERLGLKNALGYKEGRQRAKTINFALMYRMGARGLVASLFTNSKGLIKISLEEAQDILSKFKESYPTIDRWCERVTSFAIKNREIELWTGRKCRYPSWLKHKGDDAAKTAVNNLIQGGAAEVLRHDICRIDAMTHAMGWPLWMHLQIHDDILMSLPEDDYERYLPYIYHEMTDWSFNVPVAAELKVGKVWGDMKTIDVTGKDYRQLGTS